MEAWDVVVVGGTVAGLRAAISAHDSGASVTILEEGALGSGSTSTAVEGLAVSQNESTFNSHAEDTIAAGFGLCDDSVVRHRTSAAFDHLAQLEKWGLLFRRSSDGAPHMTSIPGHSNSRMATSGDSTGRDIYSILEEQCMKRGISRRGDMQTLSLVTESSMVTGLITLDVQRGELVAVKAKTVILATDGLEGAWSGHSSGTALWLAADAGLTLSNMEYLGWNPMVMEMHGLPLPYAILGDGASVRSASGGEFSFEVSQGISMSSMTMMSTGEQHILDARELSSDAVNWYGDTSERVSSRLGGNIQETVVPIYPQVTTTLGGIPCDITGAVSEISGLFAAGDCACSGFHGGDMLPGNRLLESLDGGEGAGTTAANFAKPADYSGTSAMDDALASASKKYASLLTNSDSSMTRGQMATQLNNIMTDSMSMRPDVASLSSAIDRLTQLSNRDISLSDKSSLMNTELVEVLRTEGMVRASLVAVKSALSTLENCE